MLLVFASRCLVVRPETRKYSRQSGQWGLRAAVLNVVDVFSIESCRRTAISQQFVGYKTARSFEDTIVQENIRGNRLGSLTIESGAKVVIERQSTENS